MKENWESKRTQKKERGEEKTGDERGIEKQK